MPLSPEALAKQRALFETIVSEPNATRTQKEIKDEFEKRFGHRTETADIVAKLLAAERIVWIPHSYVLFARKNTCIHCRTVERGMDSPQLFLKSRRGDRADDSNPYLYAPVKSIEHWSLPRRTELRVTTSAFCFACFDSPGLEEQVRADTTPHNVSADRSGHGASSSEEGRDKTSGTSAEGVFQNLATETAFAGQGERHDHR